MHWKLTASGYAIVGLAVLCVACPLAAQDGRVSGRITGAEGAVVPHAVVTATQLASGSTRQVLADVRGCFEITPLPPGTYGLEAVKPGFKKLLRGALLLTKGAAITLALQMEATEAVSDIVDTEARMAKPGILVLCGLSPGSVCEAIEPADLGFTVDLTALRTILP